MPVIIPDHITHSEIKIEGAKAISAGFFHLERFHSVVVHKEGSESLKLKPKKIDTQLLQGVIDHQSTSLFIKWESL